MGVVDVAVALAFAAVSIAVVARMQRGVTDQHRVVALRAVSVIIGVVPACLALYFVAGERVRWEVLVIGLAWRAWLLLYSLPYLVAALDEQPVS